MRGNASDKDRGVSLLVEYLLLTAILGVFVVVLGLSLHDTLTEAQVSRVAENQFADVASQISAYYTDYILLKPSSGYIKTDLSVLPKIGDYEYTFNLTERDGKSFIFVKSKTGNFIAESGLGLNRFISASGEVVEITASGEVSSSKAASEEESPQISYEREETCPFDVKPRMEFEPSSIELGGSPQVRVYFANADEITKPVAWEITLWNGTSIDGAGTDSVLNIGVSDITGCVKIGDYDYKCTAKLFAWINDSRYISNGIPICNGSVNESLLVSENPKQSNPYIVYDKWVEPQQISPGDTFEMHLRLEGRGFINQKINLSTVHIIDVSGSMDWDAIYKEFNQTIVPNIVERTVNTTEYSPNPGKLEIYAYTTDKLSNWYYDLSCYDAYDWCDNCNPPPWNGKGMDASFIKLYVNDVDSGTAYTNGNKVGKQYSISSARGSYKIEVVARAPEQINLTLLVKFNGSVVLNETVRYSNYREFTFDLPPDVDFSYLKISDFQGSRPYWNIERSCWWWWCNYECTYRDNHNDGNVLLNAWIIEPNGNKNFTYDVYRHWWGGGYTEYSYENNKNTQAGVYKIIVVPTTKQEEQFKAKVYVKRMDAAKLAAIQFNKMLGEGDFVGLTKFSTHAYRIEVNSSPLEYMTTDKDYVNNEVLSLSPGGATNHADALYKGVKVFPSPDEAGNNCTECINNTRPLMILLTDGETTECDQTNYFNECNLCDGSCNGAYFCQSGADQAKCVANYIKNNVKVNGFHVPICTIGFGTDIGSEGQDFLRDIASPRPDNGQPCYFFATTSEELLDAYKTIFNAFQIAARNISINESLNVTISGPFEFVDATATSSAGSHIDLQVEHLSSATVVTLNIPSIQKNETIELTVKLKVKEEAEEGTYQVNNEGSDVSYIDFTPLNYLGQTASKCPQGSTKISDNPPICRVPIRSDRDKVVVKSGEGGVISLG